MSDAPDFDAIQATSRHGTRARYKHGCRCDPCQDANTTYQRQRRAALRSEAVSSNYDPNREGWIVPLVGIAVGLAATWAVIRNAVSG